MANIYVRSTDGNDADNGSTWALSKATVAGAAAIDAAGDTIWVSQAHAESVVSSSCPWAGTAASPTRILAGDDGAEPPTALSTAPTLTVTGTTFSWSGSMYAYGLNWRFSSGSTMSLAFNPGANGVQTFENCSFYITGSGANALIIFGAASAGSYTELRGCSFRFANSGQRFNVARDVRIRGGSWAAGGTSPTGIFVLAYSNRGTKLLVEGFDFSALAAATNLVQAVNDGGLLAIFRNCKLPASWSGALVASSAMKPGSRVEMHNCDSSNTNYRMWVEDYAGTILSTTAFYRDSGATDGTTNICWWMSSGANVGYPASTLDSIEIAKWNDTVDSSITATVEIATSGSALKDSECWLEVQYPGDSNYPLSSIVDDRPADVLTAAADQTTSTATWSGMSADIFQKLSVSFTPRKKGYLLCKVKLAKASTTVYVDPMVTLS